MQLDNPARGNCLAFAKRGYPVFPLHSVNAELRCTCGAAPTKCSAGKHPFEPLAPHGFKNATTDADKIKSWFDLRPWLNFGICTETLPTVDIDPRHGGDKSWRKLLKPSIGNINSWRVVTGGGGEHIICKLAGEPIAGRDLAPGVELKSAGGYIVGVGSLHESGRRYQWAEGCGPLDLALAPFPDWISQLAPAPTKSPRTPEALEAWLEELLAPPATGSRHKHARRLLGYVFGPFPDPRLLYRLALSHIHATWDLTDLDDEEILEIARYIRRKEKQEAAL